MAKTPNVDYDTLEGTTVTYLTVSSADMHLVGRVLQKCALTRTLGQAIVTATYENGVSLICKTRLNTADPELRPGHRGT